MQMLIYLYYFKDALQYLQISPTKNADAFCRRHTRPNPLQIPCRSSQDPPGVRAYTRGILWGSAGDPRGIWSSVTPALGTCKKVLNLHLITFLYVSLTHIKKLSERDAFVVRQFCVSSVWQRPSRQLEWLKVALIVLVVHGRNGDLSKRGAWLGSLSKLPFKSVIIIIRSIYYYVRVCQSLVKGNTFYIPRIDHPNSQLMLSSSTSK